MGLFDYFELVGPSDWVLCYEGHECRSFQTKDLENLVFHYYVFDRCLYKLHEGEDYEDVSDYEYVPSVTGLEIVQKHRALPVSLGPKATVVASARCEECKPIYITSRWEGRLQALYPWVEYRFGFDGGLLTDVNIVRVESREDVRRLATNPLDDDDPRVVALLGH
jgi:hypothetical protein